MSFDATDTLEAVARWLNYLISVPGKRRLLTLIMKRMRPHLKTLRQQLPRRTVRRGQRERLKTLSADRRPGYLRRSVKMKRNGLQIRIYNEARYSRSVDFRQPNAYGLQKVQPTYEAWLKSPPVQLAIRQGVLDWLRESALRFGINL